MSISLPCSKGQDVFLDREGTWGSPPERQLGHVITEESLTFAFALCLGCVPPWRGVLSWCTLSAGREPLRWMDMRRKMLADCCLRILLGGASDASSMPLSTCTQKHSGALGQEISVLLSHDAVHLWKALKAGHQEVAAI